MSKYFGIFADSGDVQTALNESALTKPYVAIVSGVLDYNTVDAGESGNYIGEWTDNGLGNYDFEILDGDPSLWENETLIATSELYFNGDLTNMEFKLKWDASQDSWYLLIVPEGGEASDGASYDFFGEDDWPVDGLSGEEGGSDCITIYFNGGALFTFNDPGGHMIMDTINPVAPEPEPIE